MGRRIIVGQFLMVVRMGIGKGIVGKGQTIIDYAIADEKAKQMIKSSEVGNE